MTESKSENLVRKYLEAEGWAVLKNGFPDFLCVRGREYKWVEVKHDDEPLRGSQDRMFTVLRSVGQKVEIARVLGSNRIRTGGYLETGDCVEVSPHASPCADSLLSVKFYSQSP